MSRSYGLFRVGFPYVKTIGMRRVTNTSMDVAIGKGGTVYVLGRTGQISRLTFEDDDLGNVCGPGRDDGRFVWPVAMVIDGDDNLWVTDESLNRVTVLNTDGEFVRKWGDPGEEDGQLNGVSGIAFDSEENVYVADTLNHRIQKFTNDGRFLLKWGGLGDAEGDLNMPWGITVDELGDVYVADWRNDRVQKFSADGEHIYSLGRSGSGKGEFNRPAGVEVDGDGDVYVADTGNNRVQQFDAQGRYVDQFIGDATVSKLSQKYLMANARVLRLREMADLERQKRLRNPRSVRLDGQGKMYVPDFGAFRVQIYQKEVIHLEPGEIDVPLRAPTLLTV